MYNTYIACCNLNSSYVVELEMAMNHKVATLENTCTQEPRWDFIQNCEYNFVQRILPTSFASMTITTVTMTKTSSTSPMFLLVVVMFLLPKTMIGFASAVPISTVLPSEVRFKMMTLSPTIGMMVIAQKNSA